jgi:23S rRNA (pseudouridine1915-N3)-methyltransferase
MPKWVEQGVEDYSRRLPREIKLAWKQVPVARRVGDATAQQLCEREGKHILKAVPAGDTVIALDVLGKRRSTQDLADALSGWQMQGISCSLLIGGPDGLSDECLARADQRWSLSDLTLPHPLVRVVLAEQLYRAWTMTVNHPYHRQ